MLTLLTDKRKKPVNYPDSDGKPMAETHRHVLAIMMLHQALENFLSKRHQPLWVASNIFWYYSEGNTNKRISPDTMALIGVPPADRSFRSWEQAVSRPDVIFEFTSKATRKEDLQKKHPLYESLGVPEYFLFDPFDQYLKPRFQGFRLVNNRYEAIDFKSGRLESRLGFMVEPDGQTLRIIDPKTETRVPSYEELVARIAMLESHAAPTHNGKSGNGHTP